MEGTAMSALTTALTTGFTTIAGDMLSGMGAIVPVALPVLGGFLLVRIGIKIFRRIAN